MKVTFFCIFIAVTFAEVYFEERFDDKAWDTRWVQSTKKSDFGKFERSNEHHLLVDNDIEMGLRTPQDARFYAASAKFNQPFSNKGQELVVQFSVKNPDAENGFCAGGYIKLLPENVEQLDFGGDSDYYIMFGPDLCGYETSRIHVIFNHEGNNLLKDEDIKLEYDDKDSITHLYTLVVRPDNTYTVYFDNKERAHGFLHDDWAFPPKEIPDPTDIKPEDWVDDELIVDPDDSKPVGWDDIPKMIADPDAEVPSDWDEEDDGEWEAPMIQNPDWKGQWEPRKIKNPEFKGVWVQKLMPNPKFEEDVYVYDNIGAVGIELWVVNSGAIFDNIYIGNSLDEAKKLAKETFDKIHNKEVEAQKEYKDKKNDEIRREQADREAQAADVEDLDEMREEL